ncbi:hypothetical protein ACU686_23480 [Yinghuangia aomiensis]
MLDAAARRDPVRRPPRLGALDQHQPVLVVEQDRASRLLDHFPHAAAPRLSVPSCGIRRLRRDYRLCCEPRS